MSDMQRVKTIHVRALLMAVILTVLFTPADAQAAPLQLIYQGVFNT